MENTGLYCQHCGELNDAQAQFCRKCGKPQVQVPPVSAQVGGTQVPPPMIPPAAGQVPTGYPPPPPAAAAEFRGYAGFWIRFLAVIIDGAVVSAVMIPLWIVFGGVMIAALGVHPTVPSIPPVPGEPPDVRAFMGVLPMLVMFWPVGIAVSWLYEALMTSSPRQATLGKMALHLKVTDKDGRRLSFLHATGRHFAKWINGFTMNIGYIIAGLTERKQGLHDMIAGTYVIRA
jgi:uncharacterized RDD family membrane protein YckC